MNIYKNINNVKIKKPFVTVGTFDGVHLGHQYIFKKLAEEAQINNGESVVITFWPHPRIVLNKDKYRILILNTIEEKIELIEKLGIDHFIILPFTYGFSQLSSQDFIENYLVKALGIKGLIVGYDHKFGKDRLGDFELLKKVATNFGFAIKKFNVYRANGQNISSTIIRNALVEGQIEKANSYLSRSYTIVGQVINGKQIGRNIGFPTANIQPDSSRKVIPKDGVYAVMVLINNNLYTGMLNIGIRPTIDNDSQKSIEVHIINYNGNLYGCNLKLIFHKRIRNEMKFKSIDDLIIQLNRDKLQIENYFDKNFKI